MASVERLATIAEVNDEVPDPWHVSVKARHEAVLTDGRRVVLLDDRGWGETRLWAGASAEDIEATTRVVVGPDEPPEGRTRDEMETGHWTVLARILQGYGVIIDAQELGRLPHDVILSEQMLARIGRDPAAATE